MLRHSALLVALSTLLAMNSFAAVTKLSTSTGTSSSEAASVAPPTSAKKSLVTLQLIQLSSKMTMEAGGTNSVSSRSASVSGSDLVGGVAVGFSTKISDSFGFQVDLAHLMKKFTSSEQDGEKTNEEGDESYQLRTLRLTGMARGYLVPQFSLGAGIYASEFIGDQKYTDSEGTVTKSSFEESSFKRLDYGAVVGARGEFPLGSNLNFVADARYFYGIANTVNKKTIPQADEAGLKIHTRDVEIAAGLGLSF